ncbi:MAG: hypothetical protein WDZ70_02725 [Candidatus Paceibacterota bacterium]
MIDKELLKYIQDQRMQGVADKQIRSVLLDNNWDHQMVEQAFAASKNSTVPGSARIGDNNLKFIYGGIILLLVALGIFFIFFSPYSNKESMVESKDSTQEMQDTLSEYVFNTFGESSSSVRIDGFNISFNSPWGFIEDVKGEVGTLAQYTFDDGTKLTISMNTGNIREEYINSEATLREGFLLIERILLPVEYDGFDFMKLLLETTQEDIETASSEEKVAYQNAHILKEVVVPSSQKPYEFNIGDARGFVFGIQKDPQQNRTVLLWDEEGVMYTVMVPGGQNVTKSEIDQVISTFSFVNKDDI